MWCMAKVTVDHLIARQDKQKALENEERSYDNIPGIEWIINLKYLFSGTHTLTQK